MWIVGQPLEDCYHPSERARARPATNNAMLFSSRTAAGYRETFEQQEREWKLLTPGFRYRDPSTLLFITCARDLAPRCTIRRRITATFRDPSLPRRVLRFLAFQFYAG